MTNDYKLTPEQQKLVEDNIKLVYGVISDKFSFLYNLPKDEFQDVEQVGKLALCSAARQYNPEKSKFSTFAYMAIRQDLQEFVTKSYVVSEKEIFANDLEDISDNEKGFSRPADFSAYFADDKAETFSECKELDIKAALKKFFEDERVTDIQKRCVMAFLYSAIEGYSSVEAGFLVGVQNCGTARNFVARGRKILKNRREFKALWENSSLKSLAS